MWCLKRFYEDLYEAPQRSAKIKIQLNFFSSFGIGTGKVNVSYKNKTEGISLNYSLGHQLREVSKYGVISGPYFPVFGLNTGKYGSEKTPYLDTFHAVISGKMNIITEKYTYTD